MKRYVIIAGVNGAGKSTFYSSENAFCDIKKINLDETVRSIGDWKNPADVARAAKMVLARIEEYFSSGTSFSQETTLCGKAILNNIRRAKSLGYRVEVYYVGLDSADTAIKRVQFRVRRGGHGIPDSDIERRYLESLRNLQTILPDCDLVSIYDNTHFFRRFAIFKCGKCVFLSENVPEWYDNSKIGR